MTTSAPVEVEKISGGEVDDILHIQVIKKSCYFVTNYYKFIKCMEI